LLSINASPQTFSQTLKSLKRQIQFGFHCEEPPNKENVMKRNLFGILSLVVLSLMFTATGAFAQAYAKANVPFDFKVGSAQLPAGSYEVKVEEQGTISIRNGDSTAAAMSNARREYPRNTTAKLVFHKVGSEYFLAEIWRNSSTEGMIVPTSKQEKELQKELQASNGNKGGYEEVVVALN
jgi:hypothetical protein